MPGSEKRHNRTRLTGLWKLIEYLRMSCKQFHTVFLVCLFIFCLLSATRNPFSVFFKLIFFPFLVSKLVLVHLALIFVSQAVIYPEFLKLPWNDGNQFSQEIRTPMTSRACSLRLIRPIWTADKRKDFCPLCLLLKSCWKSAHAFSSLCLCYSFLLMLPFFSFLRVVLEGGRCDVDKGMELLEGVRSVDMVSPPWIKPCLFPLLYLLFYSYFWDHYPKRLVSKNWRKA